jgi:hypothetical protein
LVYSKKCWNCIKIDENTAPEVYKDPDTGRWIETNTGKPHDFKICWRKAVNLGLIKPEFKEDSKPYVFPDSPARNPNMLANHLARLKTLGDLFPNRFITVCDLDNCFCQEIERMKDPKFAKEYKEKAQDWLDKFPVNK